jgi:hypothetical protein
LVGQYGFPPLLRLKLLALDVYCFAAGGSSGPAEWILYYGLYANAHRWRARKASFVPISLRMIEEEPRPLPSKDWAEMIRKVYEVDTLFIL